MQRWDARCLAFTTVFAEMSYRTVREPINGEREELKRMKRQEVGRVVIKWAGWRCALTWFCYRLGTIPLRRSQTCTRCLIRPSISGSIASRRKDLRASTTESERVVLLFLARKRGRKSSGTYFIRLKAGSKTRTQRLTVVR